MILWNSIPLSKFFPFFSCSVILGSQVWYCLTLYWLVFDSVYLCQNFLSCFLVHKTPLQSKNSKITLIFQMCILVSSRILSVFAKIFRYRFRSGNTYQGQWLGSERWNGGVPMWWDGNIMGHIKEFLMFFDVFCMNILWIVFGSFMSFISSQPQETPITHRGFRIENPSRFCEGNCGIQYFGCIDLSCNCFYLVYHFGWCSTAPPPNFWFSTRGEWSKFFWTPLLNSDEYEWS